TPNWRAQLAQQKMSPPLSTPCPRIVQLQCAHLGAIAWAAHSKLSKVPLSCPRVRVNVLSYSLPQVSHTAMEMAPISDEVVGPAPQATGSLRRPRRGSLLGGVVIIGHQQQCAPRAPRVVRWCGGPFAVRSRHPDPTAAPSWSSGARIGGG